MVGYFGSSGKNLRISRNINQPWTASARSRRSRPSSPIRPGAPLGNITQVESTGFSSYHALWVSATKRLSRGLLFDASYTWSKSLDTNSLNSSGFAVQNGYDIPNQYGLSDFDARHRFVLSATYELPFTGHALTRGWQLAAIVQAQSGNPVNIVTSNSTPQRRAEHRAPRPDRPDPHHRLGGSVVRSVGVRGGQPVRQPRPQRGDRSRVSQHRSVAHQDADAWRNATACSCGRMCSMCSTTPNFGPPGNIVGQPDVRQDHEDAAADGRGGLVASDPVGGEAVVLKCDLRMLSRIVATAGIAVRRDGVDVRPWLSPRRRRLEPC